MSIEIALSREGGDWPPDTELSGLAERAAFATERAVPRFPASGEVSILFADDAHMNALNRDWRGVDRPTNVLSFPSSAIPMENGAPPLGDIVLGFETVIKEAAEADLTLADHISHLLVHGLLHLIGYDHRDDAEATAMEALETAVLAGLGIADPYAGTEPLLTDNAGNH